MLLNGTHNETMAVVKDRNGNDVNTEKRFGIKLTCHKEWGSYSFWVKKYKTSSAMLQAFCDLKKQKPFSFEKDPITGEWVPQKISYSCWHVYYDLFPRWWGVKHKEK